MCCLEAAYIIGAITTHEGGAPQGPECDQHQLLLLGGHTGKYLHTHNKGDTPGWQGRALYPLEEKSTPGKTQPLLCSPQNSLLCAHIMNSCSPGREV
jgi:hypothetical protein